MTISKEEAIEIARRAAKERGWRWEEPVRVSRSRRFVFFGRLTYEVWTNAKMRGCNGRYVVDGEDGTVREAYWLPR
jgi:hypothetical protein